MVGALVKVHFVDSGPFRGRAYEVSETGQMGRRRFDLETRVGRATKDDRKALARMVSQIPDQHALDEILGRVPDVLKRAEMLSLWRQWLRFEPKEV